MEPVYINKPEQTCNTQLGHVRLSIIDLSEVANQPIYSTDGNYVIIFNGEIYNYKSLKEQLKEFEFRTSSDTEVLLNLYIKFGEKALNMLNGMFAFAVYNIEKEELFCARDQIGIKPFYYYNDSGKFVFSSEIHPLFSFKGIKKQIDKEVLPEFLLNGFLYPPDTGFVGIKKLEPGHCIKVKLKDNRVLMEKIKYWDPVKKSGVTIEKTNTGKIIKNSVHDHLIADVPVGLFFSGGIDSSIILSHLKNSIKSFIIKFDEEEVKQAGIENDFYYAENKGKIYNADSHVINADERSEGEFVNLVDKLSLLSEELN